MLGTARFSAKKSSWTQNIARDTAHRAERVRRTARMAETSPCTRDRRRGWGTGGHVPGRLLWTSTGTHVPTTVGGPPGTPAPLIG